MICSPLNGTNEQAVSCECLGKQTPNPKFYCCTTYSDIVSRKYKTIFSIGTITYHVFLNRKEQSVSFHVLILNKHIQCFPELNIPS